MTPVMIRARPCIGKESEAGQNRKLEGQEVGPLVDPKRVQVQLSSIRIKLINVSQVIRKIRRLCKTYT